MPATRASIYDAADTLTTDDAWNDNENDSHRLQNNRHDLCVTQALN